MRVKLDRVFPLAATAAESWGLLQDVEKVAECMPGAKITEQIDATHYKGEVTIKIGPATTAFKGDIEVKDLDREAQRIQLAGKGSDTRGASTASMDLTADIRDVDDGSSELSGACEVVVNGKLASFGSRMMTQVSNQILQQFADNFANGIERETVSTPNQEAEVPETTAAGRKPGNELNALTLMWKTLVGIIKDLFGRKTKSSS